MFLPFFLSYLFITSGYAQTVSPGTLNLSLVDRCAGLTGYIDQPPAKIGDPFKCSDLLTSVLPPTRIALEIISYNSSTRTLTFSGGLSSQGSRTIQLGENLVGTGNTRFNLETITLDPNCSVESYYLEAVALDSQGNLTYVISDASDIVRKPLAGACFSQLSKIGEDIQSGTASAGFTALANTNALDLNRVTQLSHVEILYGYRTE